MGYSVSYDKQIPSLGNYDVVVLGGGPAGVCAATQAARSGSRVLLVESTGMLGGMATSSLVGPFMTNYDRDGNRPLVGGLYREIVARMEKKGTALSPDVMESPSLYTSFIEKYHRHVAPFDPFMLQVELDYLLEEAGAEVLLYARFADCITENGKIKSVILACLEGLRSVEATVFIDCTGTASVAAAAGVEYWKGEEGTGIPQPGTLMFTVENVDDDAYNAFGQRPERPVKAYRTPQKGQYTVNHYHVYSVDSSDSRQMSDAHKEARRQVLDAYHVLHDKTPGFENAYIGQVASILGVRENRHIVGRYTITTEDIMRGTKFEDRIAAYGFGMDIHGRTPEVRGNFKIEIAEAYYVPFRSLVPLGCDNLLVAGKTISCHSQAAGGLRCMPCAMAMGQAAGLAANMAINADVPVGDVNVPQLQEKLLALGAILD